VFLQQLVEDLRLIPNLTAVVLSGSYASRTHHENSDLDIGLYYHEAAPFPIAAIKHIAIVQHDYDQQPTYGFYSIIYLAETRICIPLHDLGGHKTTQTNYSLLK
jgi:hypothetical protein